MISYAESSLLDERGLTGANISRINGVVDNAGETQPRPTSNHSLGGKYYWDL